MIDKNKLFKTAVAALAAVSLLCAFGGCSSDKSSKKIDSFSDTQKNEEKENKDASADVNSSASVSESGAAESKDAPVSGAPSSKDAPVSGAPSSKDAPVSGAPSKEETKYGNAEIYNNESGKPAAKTENGTEVELTNENMNKLFEEYQKVQGSGSDEEKELLDQIQLILEASPNVTEAPAE